jgi:hypothetical protein
MATIVPKSWMLVYLGTGNGPKQWQRGMVVHAQPIEVPYGRLEGPPTFGIIQTELTVAELADLLEEYVIYYTDENGQEVSRVLGLRKLRLNIDAMPAFIEDGISQSEVSALKKMTVGDVLTSVGVDKALTNDVASNKAAL